MGKLNKALSLIICIALMLTVAVAPISPASAETLLTGTVITQDDPLSVRSGPGSSYERIGLVDKGSTVTITDSTTHKGWYEIVFGEGKGYVSATYIKVNPVYTPDVDFEAYMTEQGFPESYKPALRELHASNPNWIFVAQKTNIKWADAVAGECVLGRSLVQKLASYPDAYYSFQQGAYNPVTDKHVVFDGSNWVQASDELIKYSLDPRNYLTSDYLFAFLSLSYSPTETVENINGILKSTFMGGAYPADFDEHATYADAFLAAAKETGVSAYHLASRCRQEQGVNGSALSRGDVSGYEGYYNFFNINAYASAGLSNIQMGALYAKNQGWDTPYKSILGGAQFLAKGYISVGQDTLYLQKFDLIEKGGYYTHQYMTNIQAAFSEAGILKKAMTADMLASNLTFNIPIFDEMPEPIFVKPTGMGNNNYLLKALSIEGHQLTPAFSPYTYEYEMVVDSEVELVNISAEAAGKGATVDGIGEKALEFGDNKIEVTVTAQSGTKRVYIILVARQEPPVDPPDEPITPDPTIGGTKYTIDTYITGIAPETTVSDFITNLDVKDGTVTITDSNGNEKNEGNICSGDKVSIYKAAKTLFLSYEAVIYGDINADGKISTIDLFMGQRHILGTYTLSGARLEAADINRDGKLSTVDLFMGQRHILGTYTIIQ